MIFTIIKKSLLLIAWKSESLNYEIDRGASAASAVTGYCNGDDLPVRSYQKGQATR